MPLFAAASEGPERVREDLDGGCITAELANTSRTSLPM
jgi:hypothetical protein